MDKETKTHWYEVKVLFESIHTGEPLPDNMDEHDSDPDLKLYEESILLVRAGHIDSACKIAEEKAKEEEIEYLNAYGECVKKKYMSTVDAFELFDSEIVSGVEVYSRFIHAKKGDTASEIIKRYYPEVLDNGKSE
ncbi:DUF4288 domain-containing protein [Salinithrix halophila]|uniref:DUF4288 domain-containing protein n=1 Tax=Salinithrix halophila TaxID=1485204 RepID=A0ABV8JIC4_9BACL